MNLKIPEIYRDLFKTKSRYKVYYGGRGGGKSHQIAIALLLKAAEKPIRILCTREIQRTISDSVLRLLRDKITELGLTSLFVVTDKAIRCVNGSLFIFAGLRTNTSEIKSLEGIDYCWVEEAHAVREDSWDILIPTIRKPESEIWISFNPDEEMDSTFTRFAINPPESAIVKKVTYTDNPFFPDVLRQEMEHDKRHNLDKWRHIWQGEPKKRSAAAIYRFNDTINCVETQEYLEGHETFTGWDFGIGDDTVIIFFHVLKVPPTATNPKGIIISIFDEYSNNDQGADHYRQIVDNKGYNIDCHYCDPSGKNRDADLSSWLDKLAFNKKTGRKDWHFEYRHDLSINEMVDHANEFMPYIRISRHKTPKCYMMFKRWEWKTDEKGNIVLPAKPLHNEYSHFGTAFYYFICNYFPVDREPFKVYLK